MRGEGVARGAAAMPSLRLLGAPATGPARPRGSGGSPRTSGAVAGAGGVRRRPPGQENGGGLAANAAALALGPDACKATPGITRTRSSRRASAGVTAAVVPAVATTGGIAAETAVCVAATAGEGSEVEEEVEQDFDGTLVRRTSKELKSKVTGRCSVCDYRARNRQLADQCRHLQSELKAISSSPVASEEAMQVRVLKDRVSDLERQHRLDQLRSQDLRRQIEWLQRNEATRIYRSGLSTPCQALTPPRPSQQESRNTDADERPPGAVVPASGSGALPPAAADAGSGGHVEPPPPPPPL
eukprot:CAMPEP_0179082466 /NCGR_PEP_ID=MMETSP0796-20121207/37185_1 /TAXON_ID=73915 /ORGANISM="Pyrodinium bahamense, Strain pbaha01" /LENGTH=298 /DNA_ID=CAMNT_0020779859 /DNA_START=47 /DNA_END=940 /DNA_ORIENTATION=-